MLNEIATFIAFMSAALMLTVTLAVIQEKQYQDRCIRAMPSKTHSIIFVDICPKEAL